MRGVAPEGIYPILSHWRKMWVRGDDAAMSETIERDLRAAFGAYEYLRDHDLPASTTSHLLRQGDLVWLARRGRDELDELRGAVAGTHGHGGGRDDIVLEAYQALYWLTLLAVAAHDSYEQIGAHNILAHPPAGSGEPDDAAPAGISDLRDAEKRRQVIRGGLAALAVQCRLAGLDCHEAVQRDLAELRSRPYMAPYWARYDGLATEEGG